MKRYCGLLLLLLAGACGGPPAEDEVAADTVELSMDSIETLIEQEAELPPMPDHPVAEAGYVAIHSVGDLDLERGWAATGQYCEAAGVLLLLGQADDIGASLRIDLPSGDSLTGTYTITALDTASAPVPLTAQFGLQRFETQTLEAYRATEGTVDLALFDSARVSGRLAVTVSRTTNRLQSRLAGTFTGVPVVTVEAPWCPDAALEADSAAAADTTPARTAP